MSDASDVHGGLLALTQLSDAFSTEPERLRQEVRYRLSPWLN
jgi:hypothetical protein